MDKPGPKATQVRELREARAAKTKLRGKVVVRAVGKLASVKAAKR